MEGYVCCTLFFEVLCGEGFFVNQTVEHAWVSLRIAPSLTSFVNCEVRENFLNKNNVAHLGTECLRVEPDYPQCSTK